MRKKRYYIYHKPEEDVDLHDIHELIEMGLDKEEIAKELGISKEYVKKVIEEYYDDHWEE